MITKLAVFESPYTLCHFFATLIVAHCDFAFFRWLFSQQKRVESLRLLLIHYELSENKINKITVILGDQEISGTMSPHSDIPKLRTFRVNREL